MLFQKAVLFFFWLPAWVKSVCDWPDSCLVGEWCVTPCFVANDPPMVVRSYLITQVNSLFNQNCLFPGFQLGVGEGIISSPLRTHALLYTSAGDICVYSTATNLRVRPGIVWVDGSTMPLWCAGVDVKAPALPFALKVLESGNLVAYDNSDVPYWSIFPTHGDLVIGPQPPPLYKNARGGGGL